MFAPARNQRQQGYFMQRKRLLQLETLEDRTAPAAIPPAVVVPVLPNQAAALAAPSSAFLGGLMTPIGAPAPAPSATQTTTTPPDTTVVVITPPAGTTTTITPIAPIGTPISQ
jgi:hypothetical protein